MKKVVLSAALTLAVVGSWAFYPKAAAAAGYMMLVGKMDNAYATLTIISDNGQPLETPVTISKLRYRFRDLHQAELLKLNQLRQEGWRVISSTTSPTDTRTGGDIVSTETTFVLEKN